MEIPEPKNLRSIPALLFSFFIHRLFSIYCPFSILQSQFNLFSSFSLFLFVKILFRYPYLLIYPSRYLTISLNSFQFNLFSSFSLCKKNQYRSLAISLSRYLAKFILNLRLFSPFLSKIKNFLGGLWKSINSF